MKYLYLPILTCLATLTLCQCGQPAGDQSLFDSVYAEKPIQLVIETDLSILLDKQHGQDWQPTSVNFEKTACKTLHLPGKVKPRGVFRKENCDFPPLKLKFEPEELAKLGLKEYNSLKLVTHCREDFDYEQVILKEYLAFRCYNVLTDRSFRVQLANIRYVDSGKKLPDIERYGFLIEDDDELADRLGGHVLEDETGAPTTVDMPQYKLFVLYQFLIGNTDWSLSNRHNAKLIQPNDLGVPMPFPVPYDFDFCGMVDAPYAVPAQHLPIKDVKERFFLWKGQQQEDFTETFALFQSKKQALLETCRSFDLLSEENRQEVVDYLESFYELLKSPEQIVGR
ncbi:MAG: hypothetical protein H6577_03420 [Lewinellaceae bacterium]|nr:hypothetical protein [Saprospiraceae bacterium]MCB9337153.1 hypothetical protein [Lewinellaceae bacterium]